MATNSACTHSLQQRRHCVVGIDELVVCFHRIRDGGLAVGDFGEEGLKLQLMEQAGVAPRRPAGAARDSATFDGHRARRTES